MSDLSESFYINIVSLFIGLIVLIIRYIYRSKCNEFILCCNLFSFKRDTKSELELDKLKIDKNIISNNNIDLENNNSNKK